MQEETEPVPFPNSIIDFNLPDDLLQPAGEKEVEQEPEKEKESESESGSQFHCDTRLCMKVTIGMLCSTDEQSGSDSDFTSGLDRDTRFA